jgi:hypothetical protein
MEVIWVKAHYNYLTGKYALAFAELLLEKGGINLKGMALGNAWVSPV